MFGNSRSDTDELRDLPAGTQSVQETEGQSHRVRYEGIKDGDENLSEDTRRVLGVIREAQDTFKNRNELYGSAYKHHGAIMVALFPNGLNLKSESDFNRFGILNMIISKMYRYTTNFEEGGHQDSAHDAGVYGFLLEDLTRE